MPDDSASLVQKFAIGQPVPRSEDPRLLTGGGRYTDDANAPGQAYAVFARATVAHGTIRSLDTRRAKTAPGVLAVYTAADLKADGIGDIPCPIPVKSRDGSAAIVPPRPALAEGRVRHVGDAYAVVVANSRGAAQDAVELIEANIEPLSAVADPVAAAKAGAPVVWDQAKGNICLDFFFGDDAKVNDAFAKAHHISRLVLDNTRVVVNAMEPRAGLGQWDPKTETFTLDVPSQGVAGYRATIAGMFKVPPAKIRVISNEVGGSFGMKGSAFNESVLILYAARKLGRPVKWCADRGESFVSDHHGRAMVMDLELALDRDGHFLALRVNGVGDMGAYLTSMGPWPATMVTSRNIISVYKTPAISYAAKCVFTNTVPTGPYRGAGRPESKFFLERLIDQAAREMGIDRVEIRRRNLIAPGQFPYKTPVDLVYDSGEFEAIMDEALKRSDWAGFPARRERSKAAGKLRGIGVAPYLETTAPPGTELADIRFDPDGGVTLVSGTKDMGTGHATPFAQIVADRLGVPFERIRLVQNDSAEMSDGAGGSGGSRSVIAAGGAILRASEDVVAKGKKLAAHVLETAETDIEFRHGVFGVVGTDRRIGILQLAAEGRRRTNLPPDVPKSLDSKVKHATSPASYPNGCHVCEVEIDPETGEIHILRYTVVDDFGTVINPLIVEGQVHGGIVQGIGQVLMERTVYDGSGQLLTGSFMDYAMPRAEDVTSFDFSTHPVQCRTNPLGAKGCGEAGNGGSFPAVICAILDALAPLGVEDIELPASPHRVWQVIQAAKKR
jgi:carbon-monoxide dehydrogenase large subunit